MFWIAFFMCLFMVFALSSWLTKLMASAGYSLGSALTFVLVLNAGAMVGAIGGGWLADRFHIKYVLAAMYALAAVSLTLLGFKMPTPALFVLIGLAGASTIGTQIVANAYTGQFYPMAFRFTGLGWALGVGRSGAILAPILIRRARRHEPAAAPELHCDRHSGCHRHDCRAVHQSRTVCVDAARPTRVPN